MRFVLLDPHLLDPMTQAAMSLIDTRTPDAKRLISRRDR
jgi:hypothetical protein